MNMYNFTSTNSSEVCWKIIKYNRLSINKETIYRQFAEHPYPNSLMAIIDILEGYNIATNSYTIKNLEALKKYDKPKIVLVHINSESFFSVIYSISKESVIWYNPITHRQESVSFEDLKKIYAGIVTFIDVKDYIAEAEYENKYKRFFIKRVVEAIPAFIIIITILFIALSLLLSGTPIYLELYIGGVGIGSIICAILVHSEVNEYKSYIIEKLCPVGKIWDCSTVLKSSANNIYGVNWSTIGLAYFTGTLIVLACVGPTNLNYWRMAAYLNVITLPFIIYSLYYQIMIYRHWCIICLSILSILLYLFIISCLSGLLNLHLGIILNCFTPFVIVDLIVLWGSNMYKSLCEQNKKYNELFPYFNRVRFNKNVFYTLLDEYPLIEKVPLDMSINIGQSTAPTTILKICDPFCRSCSKSHIEMEKLYDNKNIFLQVIFYVSSKDNETKKNIIKLFFALKEKYGNQYMLQVLHDWYSQTDKNFEEFRKKYNDIDDKAINAQNNKITWLVQKNIELKIQYTPTFYINNHHMPDDFYSYNDFSSLFTDKN